MNIQSAGLTRKVPKKGHVKPGLLVTNDMAKVSAGRKLINKHMGSWNELETEKNKELQWCKKHRKHGKP